MTSKPSIRIGCASGFWGDTEFSAAQLVEHGDIDVLVFDYLAEITMSLLIRARSKDPAQGYAPDFVATMKPLMKQLKARGIQVVANAGTLEGLLKPRDLGWRRGRVLALEAITGALGRSRRSAMGGPPCPSPSTSPYPSP